MRASMQIFLQNMAGERLAAISIKPTARLRDLQSHVVATLPRPPGVRLRLLWMDSVLPVWKDMALLDLGIVDS